MLMDIREIPEVAIDSMNRTHASEVELVNRLFELITRHLDGAPVEDELAATVNEFRNFVEQHFSREEKLMQEHGFPAYQVHKGEHDRVRTELFGLVDVWDQQQNIQPLADYLANVHPGWAKNHIATMDSMTAYFIAQSQASSRTG